MQRYMPFFFLFIYPFCAPSIDPFLPIRPFFFFSFLCVFAPLSIAPSISVLFLSSPLRMNFSQTTQQTNQQTDQTPSYTTHKNTFTRYSSFLPSLSPITNHPTTISSFPFPLLLSRMGCWDVGSWDVEMSLCIPFFLVPFLACPMYFRSSLSLLSSHPSHTPLALFALSAASHAQGSMHFICVF